MGVILLSADLMVVSHVEGAAARAGAQLRTAASRGLAVELSQHEPADLVVIDLATPSLEFVAVVNRLKADGPAAPRIVAFGPHVHEARLEAARQAGCDDVMSRGQFFSQTESILRRRGGLAG